MLCVSAPEFSHSVVREKFPLLYVPPIWVYEEHNLWVLCLLIGWGWVLLGDLAGVLFGVGVCGVEGSWSVSADVLGLSLTCCWGGVSSGGAEGTPVGRSLLLSFLTSTLSFCTFSFSWLISSFLVSSLSWCSLSRVQKADRSLSPFLLGAVGWTVVCPDWRLLSCCSSSTCLISSWVKRPLISISEWSIRWGSSVALFDGGVSSWLVVGELSPEWAFSSCTPSLILKKSCSRRLRFLWFSTVPFLNSCTVVRSSSGFILTDHPLSLSLLSLLWCHLRHIIGSVPNPIAVLPLSLSLSLWLSFCM